MLRLLFLLLASLALLGLSQAHDGHPQPVSTGHSFLDRNYTERAWQALQSRIDSFLIDGEWDIVWKRDPAHRPPYNYPCHFSFQYRGRPCLDSRPNAGILYRWFPRTEKLSPWSKEHFCRAMNGRNMMIVGDSLSEESFLILRSMLLNDLLVGEGEEWSSNHQSRLTQLQQSCNNFCPDWLETSCEGSLEVDCGPTLPPFNLSFYNSWHLNLFNDKDPSTMELANWVTNVRDKNISLVLMNTGSRYTSDTKLLENVRTALQFMYEANPHMSIIYRSTVPGHPDCDWTFKSPPLPSEYPLNRYNSVPGFYHWQDFYHQNLITRQMLEAEFPSVLYFDVFNTTILRADSHPMSHRDCQHYCTPGPMDDWMLFLHHIIAIASDTPAEDPRRNVKKTTAVLAQLHPNLARYNNNIVKTKASIYYYLVQNGSRHLFYDVNDRLRLNIPGLNILGIDEKGLYQIPVGKPMFIEENWDRKLP